MIVEMNHKWEERRVIFCQSERERPNTTRDMELHQNYDSGFVQVLVDISKAVLLFRKPSLDDCNNVWITLVYVYTTLHSTAMYS